MNYIVHPTTIYGILVLYIIKMRATKQIVQIKFDWNDLIQSGMNLVLFFVVEFFVLYVFHNKSICSFHLISLSVSYFFI